MSSRSRVVDPEERFRVWFFRYYRMVHRYLLQQGAGEDAEDLAQETFVAVYRSLDGYRGAGRFESWLLKVAQNTLRRRRRDAAVAKRGGIDEILSLVPDLTIAADHPAVPRPAADPLARLLRGEQRRFVEDALATLPDQMRWCMSLYLVKGYRHSEIADLLQVSLSTVKTQISRGRGRLRKLLEVHVAGPRGVRP